MCPWYRTRYTRYVGRRTTHCAISREYIECTRAFFLPRAGGAQGEMRSQHSDSFVLLKSICETRESRDLADLSLSLSLARAGRRCRSRQVSILCNKYPGCLQLGPPDCARPMTDIRIHVGNDVSEARRTSRWSGIIVMSRGTGTSR